MTGSSPLLLMVGAPALCETASWTLRSDEFFAGAEILTRFHATDAIALLQERQDIALVLVLHQGSNASTLPDMVPALIGPRGDSLRAVMVRSSEVLPREIRERLWQLGTADRLFSQPVASPDLADSIAAALRDGERSEALARIADASVRLEHARTLWELAEGILGVLDEYGIGDGSALFSLLGGASEPRLMSVAGSGRFRDTACKPLDDCTDAEALAAIRSAMAERCSRFADDHVVLYVRTADADVACIYVALAAPLPPWQHRLLRALTNAFSIAIGKNQAAQRLQRTQHATISTMATLAEYRDVDTGEHVARVARAATEITQVLADRGLVTDREMIEQIGLAAILHDIGKIAINESILLKPGPLDLAERKTMELHTVLGRDILLQAATRSDNPVLLQRAAEIALHHHEKYDGSGYPEGLAGEQIPLAARIVALVDVFDALTSLRPYKEPWPLELAIETIRSGAGTHFDPQVVEAFLLLEERRRSADFFVWDESMSVGHPELDVDHKRLIGIINRLWVAEGNGNRQVIEFVLDDLVHYTESHFKREERMMAVADYPDFERHRAIHRRICVRLEEIRWEYFQGIREELRGEILEFLRNWLNQHILVEDMNYRPWLEPRPEPRVATQEQEMIR